MTWRKVSWPMIEEFDVQGLPHREGHLPNPSGYVYCEFEWLAYLRFLASLASRSGSSAKFASCTVLRVLANKLNKSCGA